MKQVIVSDLIKYLETLPQNLPVAYGKWSEQFLLEIKDINIVECCESRPDGWVAHARPDKKSIPYLLLTSD
jgi:hypothetical protein